VLDVIDLPPLPEATPPRGTPVLAAATPADPDADWPTLETLERAYLDRVLAHVGGNRSAAARVLGIDRRTLLRKLAARRASRLTPS